MREAEKFYIQGARDFRKHAINKMHNQTLFVDGKRNPWYFAKPPMEDFLMSIEIKYEIEKVVNEGTLLINEMVKFLLNKQDREYIKKEKRSAFGEDLNEIKE